MADTLRNYFHTVKVFSRFFIKPVFLVGFYYFDVCFDTFNTVNLLNNCHYYYGAYSISVMLSTYLTTVMFIKFAMKKSWKVATLYPTYYW